MRADKKMLIEAIYITTAINQQKATKKIPIKKNKTSTKSESVVMQIARCKGSPTSHMLPK